MIDTTSRFRLFTGVILIAGIAVLFGCGPAPYSRTTTSEQTTTTTPAPPPVTTTTTTIEQNNSPRP
jgi:multidrug efflux pump subunit AcrA (membrane-fusion protein)